MNLSLTGKVENGLKTYPGPGLLALGLLEGTVRFLPAEQEGGGGGGNSGISESRDLLRGSGTLRGGKGGGTLSAGAEERLGVKGGASLSIGDSQSILRFFLCGGIGVRSSTTCDRREIDSFDGSGGGHLD